MYSASTSERIFWFARGVDLISINIYYLHPQNLFFNISHLDSLKWIEGNLLYVAIKLVLLKLIYVVLI